MLDTLRQKFLRLDERVSGLLTLHRLAAFLHSNRFLLIFFGLASIVAYGYDLFSFSLRIDSENHAFTFGPQTAWIGQGRWGMYLLTSLLLPDVVMPFIPTLLALTGCVFGALFFVHLLSEKRSIADFPAGAIAIACPVIYFALYFTTLGYGIGIAFAASTLGVFLLGRPGWKPTLFAIPCFTLGLGIYQAVMPLIATLFCLQMTALILERETLNIQLLLRKLGIFLLVVAVAAGLNQLISALVIQSMNGHFDSSYIYGFVHFETTSDYLLTTALKTLEAGWNYYTGGKDYYLYDMPSLKILFISCLLVTTLRLLFSRHGIAIKLCGILFLLMAIVAPIMMHMVNAGYMPPRTVLGISYVLGALVFFTVTLPVHLLRLFIVCLATICFYNFSMVNNRYAFSNQMTWWADRELSAEILTRVHEAINKLPVKTDPYSQLPLEIVGWHEYFETPIFVRREVIGSSFYIWGAGDVERIVRLFKTMGVSDYRPATREERLSVIETAQQMPSWPYRGSVDIVNGIIVVKLRDYNPNQLTAICQPPFNTHPSCQKYMPR